VIFSLSIILSKLGVLTSLHRFMTKAGVIIILAVLLERCERLWIRMPSAVKYFGQ
jgi:hypothetical protein